ncbi:MAG: putative glycoside hydrolase [Chloroflexota bacterium]
MLTGNENDPEFSGTVRDAYSGDPVDGVEVRANGTAVMTDDGGRFSFDAPVEGSITVSRDAYEATEVPAPPAEKQMDITIRPTTLTGKVTNSRNGDPVVGATVEVSGQSLSSSTTVTDSDGEYLLADVPPEATISVSFNGFSQVSEPVGNNVVLDFEIRPDSIIGHVRNEDGEPVPSATIQLGDVTTSSDEDGEYQLNGVPESGSIVVKKAGYREVVGEYPDDLRFDAELERFEIRAIYVSAMTASDDQEWDDILELVDNSEINAVVLDVKDNDGLVRYDSEVPMVSEVGADGVLYDVEERLDDLREREIYAIARQVVFEDPVLAEAEPEMAVRDTESGDLWTTWDGQAWVNATDSDVWQYNIDIALEVVELGFDEVQLDYIRFPTDGPLDTADFGTELDSERRTEAIATFLEEIREELAPSGVFLAVDLFGIALWEESDIGIGQDLEVIAPLVDVVNPMIYPSHFSPGQFGFDVPNDHPYDVVLWVLERGRDRLGGDADKLRPWLQDFSYGPGIEYGPDQVQAQIDAVDDFEAPGWMLWSPSNEYTEAALTAGDDPQQ